MVPEVYKISSDGVRGQTAKREAYIYIYRYIYKHTLLQEIMTQDRSSFASREEKVIGKNIG